VLNLRGCTSITSDFFRKAPLLNSLTRLNVAHCPGFTFEALERFLLIAPRLQAFTPSAVPRPHCPPLALPLPPSCLSQSLKDEDFSIITRFQSLTELDLSDREHFSSRLVHCVSRMTTLRSLVLENTLIQDSKVRTLGVGLGLGFGNALCELCSEYG